MPRSFMRLVALLAVLALVTGGCADEGGTDTTVVPEAPATTVAATMETGPVPAGDLTEIRDGIVRIVAQGTFVDPDYGTQYNAAGSGSGFIVDPSGIAVTNNHVVTGAAFLEVYVGDETEPRNARVLGVSECSDLAVIDIDGDDFTYLEWFDGDVVAGMEIYAVGFPLGTEEYTVLDGIVSKENAGGESSWASVDSVIEHSADTLPGNSGGPIVTADGTVVAVNYAGDSAGQAFAIGRDEAERVLDELIAGRDVTSLGINGQAIVGDGYAGIWVASVESGSPAQVAGIEGGDVVTLLEGLVVGTDGTMADYCDILRSHVPTDPLTVEVYRGATGEFLEGTINSDEPLAVTFSFVDELDDVAVADPDPSGGYDFIEVTDDAGVLHVYVPYTWDDIDGTAWVIDGDQIGVGLSVAPSLDAWTSTWTTPGMFFGASEELASLFTADEVLDLYGFPESCDGPNRSDYSDVLYAGRWDVWQNCGGTDTVLVNVAAYPEDFSFMVVVQFQAVTLDDLEALDEALNTFYAVGY